MSPTFAPEEVKMFYRIMDDAYDMFPTNAAPSETSKNPFPMYSFERVSNHFWSQFVLRLIAKGMGEDEIRDLLQSKKMRHMLDGEGEDAIGHLAHKMANRFV